MVGRPREQGRCNPEPVRSVEDALTKTDQSKAHPRVRISGIHEASDKDPPKNTPIDEPSASRTVLAGRSARHAKRGHAGTRFTSRTRGDDPRLPDNLGYIASPCRADGLAWGQRDLPRGPQDRTDKVYSIDLAPRRQLVGGGPTVPDGTPRVWLSGSAQRWSDVEDAVARQDPDQARS